MHLDGPLWLRARPLLDAALALPAAERPAYLDGVAASDPALRKALGELVAAAEDESPFLDALPTAALDLLRARGVSLEAGARIGPYRLLRLLGEGGMGTVYLGERADGEFEQRVAIKLMRAAALAPDDVARFRRERQILAWLDHPGIARLQDGGLSDHGPFLVMEYVEGAPIDRHCADLRLGVAQRLAVFLAVCEAVEYAHRNLVIHRDLKPGNILVTPEGRVKLLDFGIARLIDGGADAGAANTAPFFTRAYASPEQIRGDPLTTASDVYSLGAVLYQLLTGRLPHELHGLSPAAVEHEVTVVSPRRPGTIRRELRGELDLIVLKALHADPSRRYGSVAALADDLRRHLAHLPITARPDTMGYRLTRFARRHAMGLGAAALLALALGAGTVSTLREKARAERRFDSVRALANALLFDLHDAVRDLPGATAARQRLVTQALTYLDQLRAESPSDPALRAELASAYERIGEIQGDPHRANTGDLAGATESYREALALRRALWDELPTDPARTHALANGLGRMAVVVSWGGDNDSAIVLSRRALELLASVRGGTEEAASLALDHGRIQSELGWWLVWAGRIEPGLDQIDSAIGRLAVRVDPRSATADPAVDLWRAYTYRLDGLRFSDRHRAALELLHATALPYLARVAERHPREARVLYEQHVGHDLLGALELHLGNLVAAREAHAASLRYAEALVAADSANQKAMEGLARANFSLGEILAREARLDSAVAALTRSVRVLERLATGDARNAEFVNMLGNAQRRLCRVLHDGARTALALEWCVAGERTLERAVVRATDNPVVRANLGSAYVATARVLRDLSRAEAGPEAARYRELARSRFGDGLRLLREVDRTGATPEIPPDSVAAELAALNR